MYIFIILMLLGVFIDQISKYLVVLYMDLHQSVEIIPGVFNFTYIQNEGAAFGSMSDSRWVFMIMSSIMIIGILVFIFWKKPKSKLLLSALTLIVAGGVGNMIDRIRLGYVIDFLDFCAFPNLWMWTFNIADSFVVVGAGIMILWLILDAVKDGKAKKAATENILAEEVYESKGDTDEMSDTEEHPDLNTDDNTEQDNACEQCQGNDEITETPYDCCQDVCEEHKDVNENDRADE